MLTHAKQSRSNRCCGPALRSWCIALLVWTPDTAICAVLRWLCNHWLAHRSEDGLRALANLELRSREAVAACTAARLAAAARIEKVTTQLGEAIIASGRELLAAGDLEVEAASLAKASPLGAEAEVRLFISLRDCSTESAVGEFQESTFVRRHTIPGGSRKGVTIHARSCKTRWVVSTFNK